MYFWNTSLPNGSASLWIEEMIALSRFIWKDRFACLRRVVVTMRCLGLDVDTAIKKALYKADQDGYAYCKHPEMISEGQRDKLRQDAEQYFNRHAQFAPQWRPYKFVPDTAGPKYPPAGEPTGDVRGMCKATTSL